MVDAAKIIRIVFLTTIAISATMAAAQENPKLKVERQDPKSDRRIALVVGNAAYSSSPLRNPVNDAKDIGRLLLSKNFQTSLLLNADKRQMIEGIREFGNKLRKGGVGLFYYAGHGMQVAGRNYLIPINANIEIENEIPLEAVDVNRVLGYMDAAKNHLNIVILDACRDNPFARSFRSSAKGFAQMDAPNGTLIAYATSPGKTAADGSGENGIYTKHLLEQMQRPGLEVGPMFRFVRKAVRRETGGLQIPWEATSLEGSFYFTETDSRKAIREIAVEKGLDAGQGIETYIMVNRMFSNGARFPYSLHMDISTCQFQLDNGDTGEWAVENVIPRSCKAFAGSSHRVVHRNGYWVDYDWSFLQGTVVHGTWKDSNSNFGTTVGLKTEGPSKSGPSVYSLVNIFENQDIHVPITFRMDIAGCAVLKEESPPDNEWRILRFITETCEPSRRIQFRSVHQNGYRVEFDWAFTQGRIVQGTWIDSNNGTGTSMGATE